MNCKSCSKPTDEKARCWNCSHRACERCGRKTTSVLLAHCFTCMLALDGDGNFPAAKPPLESKMALPESELFMQCSACRGTRKTVMVFNPGSSREVPVGSECPCCSDGYATTGMTLGQMERQRERCDNLLVALDDVRRNTDDPFVHAKLLAIRETVTKALEGLGAIVEEIRLRRDPARKCEPPQSSRVGQTGAVKGGKEVPKKSRK